MEEGVKLVISGGLLTPTRLFAAEQAQPWIGTHDNQDGNQLGDHQSHSLLDFAFICIE